MAKELERFCLSVGDSAKDDSSKAGSRVSRTDWLETGALIQLRDWLVSRTEKETGVQRRPQDRLLSRIGKETGAERGRQDRLVSRTEKETRTRTQTSG